MSCSCKPEIADATLCQLVGQQLQFRLLVAGHDMARAGVAERERCTAEVLQATMKGLDCSKHQAAPGGLQAEEVKEVQEEKAARPFAA